MGQPRCGGDQLAGVSLARRREDGRRVALVDLPAVAHDHDPVGAVGRHGQVVRDDQQGDALLADQAREVVEDALLDGDVEGAGRLVSDDQFRAPGERDGDQDPLAQTAGELVRVLPGAQLRLGDTGLGQELHDLGGDRRAGDAAQLDGLGELGADPLRRVQADQGVLRDQADRGAAKLAQRALVRPGGLHAVDQDRAGGDPAGRGQQPDQGVAGGGLAGAGLADERDHLGLPDGQIKTGHGGLDVPVPDVAHVQPGDLYQTHRLSSWNVLAMWLRLSTSRATNRPGSRLSHQAVTR